MILSFFASSRSSPGAPFGTIGLFGATGSPLLGQNDIARSASPVINQRGIHTRIGGHHTTVDDVQARVAECPVVGIDNPLVGAFADRDPADEMC